MNVYTRAITTAKRDAQTRVMDVLMNRTAPEKEEAASQNQRTSTKYSMLKFV